MQLNVVYSLLIYAVVGYWKKKFKEKQKLHQVLVEVGLQRRLSIQHVPTCKTNII